MCNLVLFERSKILLILVVNSPWPWHCFERLDSDNKNKKKMHGRLILNTRTLTVLILQRQSCSVFLQTGMVILSKTSVCCLAPLSSSWHTCSPWFWTHQHFTGVEFTKEDVDQCQTYPLTSLFTFPHVRLTANCLFINQSLVFLSQFTLQPLFSELNSHDQGWSNRHWIIKHLPANLHVDDGTKWNT